MIVNSLKGLPVDHQREDYISSAERARNQNDRIEILKEQVVFNQEVIQQIKIHPQLEEQQALELQRHTQELDFLKEAIICTQVHHLIKKYWRRASAEDKAHNKTDNWECYLANEIRTLIANTGLSAEDLTKYYDQEFDLYESVENLVNLVKDSQRY